MDQDGVSMSQSENPYFKICADNAHSSKHQQRMYALSYLYGFCRNELLGESAQFRTPERALEVMREQFKQFEEAFPWNEIGAAS